MRRKKIWLIAALCLALSTAPLQAAGSDEMIDLTADTLEYDAVTGLMTATGSVKLIQGNAVMTGAQANYNTKTQAGTVTGGVVLVKDDLSLRAAMVQTLGNEHIAAEGDVVATQGERVLMGPKIDYYTEQNYAVIPVDAKITMPDGTVTADRLESFMAAADDRLVATGNVNIVSPARNLTATSDQATYYGADKGKIILNGNAVAVQDNHTLRGNTLTLYLADKPSGA